MTDEPSPRNANDRDVLSIAVCGFPLICMAVLFVVMLPLAALQLLNDYVLHRGEGWVDQFVPPVDWLIASIAGAVAVLYLGAIPWLPRDLVLPSRRRTYALSVVGIILAIAGALAIAGVTAWLGIEDLDPYDHLYQGWG